MANAPPKRGASRARGDCAVPYAGPVTKSLAVAIDLGGTKVEAALIDELGAVVDGSRHRSPTGREATSARLEEKVLATFDQAVASAPEESTIVGVGIGSAGPIDVAAGRVSPLNIPAWRDFPLRDLVSARAAQQIGDVPVRLRIDGATITLAEHWLGAGIGVNNMMGMVISTGIGGGLILDGRMVSGRTGNAGHIGHIEVAGMTGEATFGGIGSLEAIASGPHTVAWAVAKGWSGSRGEDLAASYATGDPTAVAAIQRTGQAVGQAIGAATALLDLELVAIGGGFSQATPDLITIIRETVGQHYFSYVRALRVEPSGLSGTGPLVGAGALIHRAELVS